ncbi:MAG: helix-turn-helix domain-containing protein [Methanoregulaceae archaeon]
MRAEMVYRCVTEQGVSQSEIAKRLGVSRAAISQYLSRKRGDADIEMTTELNAVIDRWVLAVISGNANITLCDVCRSARETSPLWEAK